MPLQEEFENQGNVLFRYRGTLPIIIVVIGLIVFYYGESLGFNIEDPLYGLVYELICLVVCFLGLFVRIFTVGYAAPNTSGRNKYSQVAEEVNTSGIYSLVRHPLYVGNFLMWLGPAMLTQNLWFTVAFVLFFWVYYERIMYAEEQFLRKKFGEAYTSWAQGVPAFVPSFKNYKKPRYAFRWTKVLKSEKNGFLAIFLLFFLFDLVERFLADSWESLTSDIWFYGFIVSGVIYLVIKILKDYTSVLVTKNS